MPNCETDPFSGCNYSKKLISKLIIDLHVEQVVETGTFLGHTTQYISDIFKNVHIKTVELNKTHYDNAVKKFSENKNVECFFESSDKFLETFDKKGLVTLFYLDAHWNDYNPLKAEIKNIIKNTDGKDIIVIDDFMVPNRDFSFDNVPEGGCICFDYIKDCFDINEWTYFFKNESDNNGTKATGQFYLIHKNLECQSFIQFENGIPYSNC